MYVNTYGKDSTVCWYISIKLLCAVCLEISSFFLIFVLFIPQYFPFHMVSFFLVTVSPLYSYFCVIPTLVNCLSMWFLFYSYFRDISTSVLSFPRGCYHVCNIISQIKRAVELWPTEGSTHSSWNEITTQTNKCTTSN